MNYLEALFKDIAANSSKTNKIHRTVWKEGIWVEYGGDGKMHRILKFRNSCEVYVPDIEMLEDDWEIYHEGKIDTKQVTLMFRSGMGTRQIAEALGVSNFNICQLMIKYNIRNMTSNLNSKPINTTKKRNEIDIKEIATMYESGMSQYTIGEKFGVTSGCIGGLMKKHGIATRFYTKVTLDKQKVADLYEEHNSSIKISKMLGVSAPTILSFMRKHGIQLQTKRSGRPRKIGIKHE